MLYLSIFTMKVFVFLNQIFIFAKIEFTLTLFL